MARGNGMEGAAGPDPTFRRGRAVAVRNARPGAHGPTLRRCGTSGSPPPRPSAARSLRDHPGRLLPPSWARGAMRRPPNSRRRCSTADGPGLPRRHRRTAGALDRARRARLPPGPLSGGCHLDGRPRERPRSGDGACRRPAGAGAADHRDGARPTLARRGRRARWYRARRGAGPAARPSAGRREEPRAKTLQCPCGFVV